MTATAGPQASGHAAHDMHSVRKHRGASLLGFTTLCIALGCTRVVAAQAVGGVVLVGAAGSRVPDVSVALTSASGSIVAVARTSQEGRFLLGAPREGRYVIRVLRMGYVPNELAVVLAASDTMRVELEVTELPITHAQQLSTVVVRGKQVTLPARLDAVYRSAKQRDAALFVAEDFALTNDYTHALGTLPGVRFTARGELFLPTCGRVQVYVNGFRLMGDGLAPLALLRSALAPADVALMEVYTRQSRVPAEYSADACAVIAVWTK